MKKLFLAILALIILTACGTPPHQPPQEAVYSNPADPIFDTTPADPTLYQGWTVTLTDFNDTTAEVSIGNTTVTIKADRIYFYDQYIFENGISVIEEEYESDSFFEGDLPIKGKMTTEVNDEGYIYVYMDNRSEFIPTPQDLEIQAAWPIFVEQATTSDHPATIEKQEIENWGHNHIDQCSFMGHWSSILHWLRPFTPEFCQMKQKSTYELNNTILLSLNPQNSTQLTCGRINDRFTVSKVGQFYMGFPDKYPGEIPWPFDNFWPASAVTVFDHKMGTEEIHVLPTKFAFGFQIPEYQGWADPPITWYMVDNNEPCQIDSPTTAGEYQPPKQQYMEVKVPNERYHTATCVAYRLLGGAPIGSPNYDPQCKYPTRTETIPTIPVP